MPDDFDPPRELELPEFHLVPLGAQHNESDHAAWTSSIAHIRATPGFESCGWPPMFFFAWPMDPNGGDAQVRSWVRADVAELDGPLHAAVSRWLVEQWPFERAVYADRPDSVTC